ncbi:hypothetical protein [Deinococcus aquatilis]|uniref:hypothetical protein n=1 Tax=Deinococcus aquatilis TaxID=519440 RepID=UPI0003681A0C|nr:hypothetical protein [Deinococcus aquatilis]
MRDFLPPTLRFILEQQARRDRLLPAQQLLRLSGFQSLRSPADSFFRSLPSTLTTQQMISGPRGIGASVRSPVEDLHKQMLPAMSSSFGTDKLLRHVLGTPLFASLPQRQGKNVSAWHSIVRTETLVGRRLLWATDFTPYALKFAVQGTVQYDRFLTQQREQEQEVNAQTEQVVKLFLEEGWYILPVLLYSDFLLPITLSRAAEQGFDAAKNVLIQAIQEVQVDLQGYISEKIMALGLPEERALERRTSVESQFTLACEGKHVDNVASFMIGEAEGLFNDVTARFGLEKACFYTNDQAKIQHRTEVLDGWHKRIKDGQQLFDEEFTRRQYKMFTRTRSKVVPQRDQIQHGELGFRKQQHALWATTFLVLTLDYLSALTKLSAEPAEL